MPRNTRRSQAAAAIAPVAPITPSAPNTATNQPADEPMEFSDLMEVNLKNK